jgi:hypothetical protein
MRKHATSPRRNDREKETLQPTPALSRWLTFLCLLTGVFYVTTVVCQDTVVADEIDAAVGPALDTVSAMLIDPVIAFVASIVAYITVSNLCAGGIALYFAYRTNFCHLKTFTICVKILWKYHVWKRTGKKQATVMIQDTTDLDNFWAILLYVYLYKGTEMFLQLSFRPANFRYPSWTGTNFDRLIDIMEYIKAPFGQIDDETDTRLQGFADVARLRMMLEKMGLDNLIRIYYDDKHPAEPSCMRHEVHKQSAFLCAYVAIIDGILTFTTTAGTADTYWGLINYVNGKIGLQSVKVNGEIKQIYVYEEEDPNLQTDRQTRGRDACSQIIDHWKKTHPEQILCKPLSELYKDLKHTVENDHAVLNLLLLAPLDGLVRLLKEYDTEHVIANAIYKISAQVFATDNDKDGSKNLFPNQYNIQLALKAAQQFMKLISTFWFYRLFGYFITCPTEVFKTPEMMEMFKRMSTLDENKINPINRNAWKNWLTWNTVASRGNVSAVFDPLPVFLLHEANTDISLFPTLKKVPMHVSVIYKAGKPVFIMAPSRLPLWVNEMLKICLGYSPIYSVDPASVDVLEYMACLTGSEPKLFPEKDNGKPSPQPASLR